MEDPEDDCHICHRCLYSDKMVGQCLKGNNELTGCRRCYPLLCIWKWYFKLSGEEVVRARVVVGIATAKLVYVVIMILHTLVLDNKTDRIHHMRCLSRGFEPLVWIVTLDLTTENSAKFKAQGLVLTVIGRDLTGLLKGDYMAQTVVHP